MGNQNHSRDNVRQAIELVQSGAIGDVREVHVWTNRPRGVLAAGDSASGGDDRRPSRLNWSDQSVTRRLAAAMTGTLSGARARSRGISSSAARRSSSTTRSITRSTGAAGSTGARARSATWARTSIDFPHWALRLGLPTSIQTISTPFNDVCYPMATTTYYEFPARRGMPAVKLTWYNGGFMPPFPEELAGEPLDPNGGILYVGSKGKMLQQPVRARACCRCHGTTRSSRPKKSWRACRIRITR